MLRILKAIFNPLTSFYDINSDRIVNVNNKRPWIIVILTLLAIVVILLVLYRKQIF